MYLNIGIFAQPNCWLPDKSVSVSFLPWQVVQSEPLYQALQEKGNLKKIKKHHVLWLLHPVVGPELDETSRRAGCNGGLPWFLHLAEIWQSRMVAEWYDKMLRFICFDRTLYLTEKIFALQYFQLGANTEEQFVVRHKNFYPSKGILSVWECVFTSLKNVHIITHYGSPSTHFDNAVEVFYSISKIQCLSL